MKQNIPDQRSNFSGGWQYRYQLPRTGAQIHHAGAWQDVLDGETGTLIGTVNDFRRVGPAPARIGAGALRYTRMHNRADRTIISPVGLDWIAQANHIADVKRRDEVFDSQSQVVMGTARSNWLAFVESDSMARADISGKYSVAALRLVTSNARNINKDISVLEMDLEKGAGRAFETAMKAFIVDQMLDRDIVEQFFGVGSLSRVLPKALREIEGRRSAPLGAVFRQIEFSRTSLSGLYLGRRSEAAGVLEVPIASRACCAPLLRRTAL